jgi:regulatory protein
MSKPERPRQKRSTYTRALDMLEARARATTELRRLLIKKGEPEADVDAAIERLIAAGLLDDANFARMYTRSKALGAGMSRRRLQQELTKRGVTKELSAVAIDEVFVDEAVDEMAMIERVARKKLRTLSKVDPATRKRRLYAFLARRGYDADDIARVMRLALESNDDRGPED